MDQMTDRELRHCNAKQARRARKAAELSLSPANTPRASRLPVNVSRCYSIRHVPGIAGFYDQPDRWRKCYQPDDGVVTGYG